MDLAKFCFQLATGLCWSVIQPQIPLLLYISGGVLAWKVFWWFVALWSRPKQ